MAISLIEKLPNNQTWLKKIKIGQSIKIKIAIKIGTKIGKGKLAKYNIKIGTTIGGKWPKYENQNLHTNWQNEIASKMRIYSLLKNHVISNSTKYNIFSPLIFYNF